MPDSYWKISERCQGTGIPPIDSDSGIDIDSGIPQLFRIKIFPGEMQNMSTQSWLGNYTDRRGGV